LSIIPNAAAKPQLYNIAHTALNVTGELEFSDRFKLFLYGVNTILSVGWCKKNGVLKDYGG
ncbi:hypothetical protein X975_13265, partial [Stegodyphus mimosarum]